MPPPSCSAPRRLAGLVVAGLTAAAALMVTASPAAAATTLNASPNGSGTACSSMRPCSLTQAQAAVRAIVPAMTDDIVVQLAAGSYTLSSPLTFTAADSGANGHTVSVNSCT